MEEKQEKSLSDKDKRLIKQAVLESAAKNTNLPPDNIAKALCRAFTFIAFMGNKYIVASKISIHRCL